jgi:hypothetical protein
MRQVIKFFSKALFLGIVGGIIGSALVLFFSSRNDEKPRKPSPAHYVSLERVYTATTVAPRFEHLSSTTTNNGAVVNTYHDREAGEEIVCIEQHSGYFYVSCITTGRKW